MLTTCKHFDMVGNRCSRVTGGKCDKFPECEFKYIEELKAENEKLKADLKSLEYTVALQGKRDIDNATDLFAKHIAKIESENAILKAEKAKYYQQTLDDEIQINELYQTLQEIKEIAESKVKPNLVKRMNGTAKYGIDRIIELAEVEE